MNMFFRYSRWDGTQEILPFDADELMDNLSDDLLASGDLRSALQRLLRYGMQNREGRRLPGLQDLLERLRNRRQEELDRHNLGSLLDDIQQRLDKVLATERAGIDKRVAEGQQRTQQQQDGEAASPADQDLRQMLEKIADKKRRFLDELPKDLGGAIKGLSDYEFMDNDARQQFQELLQMLQQQVLQQYFQGIQQALQNMSPQDLQRTRDMVRDLNKMLQDKQQGREPNFQQFMQQYGDMFPPGINSLEQLVEYLQRRMAQMQSLLDSMSPEQRQSLQDLMDSLLRDDRLKWDLAQLAANLEQIMPMRDLRNRYPFRGDESLTLGEALKMMERLQDIDQMEKQLRRAQYGGTNLDQIDPEKLRDLLGEDAGQDFERLKELMKMLEEAGYVQQKGDSWELTPRGMRRIGQKALQDIFAQLHKDRLGKHQTDYRGTGGDRTYDSKQYEFGDPFLLDLEKTLMNALERTGVGTPVRITPDDFEVYRTELLTQCSTVLMVDMSRSMVLRGCFVAAKKVAMALNSLIHGQFPKDNLYVVVFSEYARELKPRDLPLITLNDYEMGTNMHHAFMLSRRLLGRHKGGTRQIIVITDGEPTAHLMPNGHAYFDYPPDPRTIRETLKEVVRCTREQIMINTFMLERSHYLIEFVNEMTKINKGRAFFATPERLGEYILVDYVAGKTKKIS